MKFVPLWHLATRTSPFPAFLSTSFDNTYRACQITREPGEVAEIYEFAARSLQEKHGVTSMTNEKLFKTLPVFKFGPRRLVDRGLAPAHLLKSATPTPVPAGEDCDCDGEEDLGVTEDFDEEESDQNHRNGSSEHPIHPKRISMYERIHAVLLNAGVEIRPKETRPLLKALGLLRCRLVGLGLIPRDDLRVSPEPGSELEKTFVVAARNLREHHGVPSMTPEMLVHTMAVLELRPRRLVGTGLAPRGALRDERQAIALGGGQNSGDGEDNVYDRFEPLDDAGADGPDYDREGSNPIHMAFIRKGIEIQPQEAMALLLALRVAPARLAKLNMVNSKQLRGFVRRFRRKARRSGAQESRRGPASGVHVPNRTGKV